MMNALYNTHAIFYELIESDYKLNHIIEECFNNTGYIKEIADDGSFVSFRNDRFRFIFSQKRTTIYENSLMIYQRNFKKELPYDYFL